MSRQKDVVASMNSVLSANIPVLPLNLAHLPHSFARTDRNVIHFHVLWIEGQLSIGRGNVTRIDGVLAVLHTLIHEYIHVYYSADELHDETFYKTFHDLIQAIFLQIVFRRRPIFPKMGFITVPPRRRSLSRLHKRL